MSTSEGNVNYNFKYFLLLMQSVFNNTPVPKPAEAVKWQIVYDIAVSHSLAGMLYYALQKFSEDELPKGVFMDYLKQMYQEQIVADLNLSVETERMLNVLSSKGIRCLPVKGISTKGDYPVPHLRTMTDVDILCNFENRFEVEKIFLQNGYVKESVGEKDTSYRKDEILHFEIHNTLVSKGSPAHSYFSKIWDRAVFKNSSSIASMTLEDTYLFMLEHLCGHIEFGGAGIRMYMDVYAFLKNHESELNREYVDKILAEISLSEFEKRTVNICRNWFSGEEEIDVTSKSAMFILNSSTFGRTSISFLSDTLRNNKGNSAAKNGIKRITKKLFPSIKWMRIRFRAVDKLPVLYPVFVPVHWVDRLIVRRNVTTSNIGDYFTSAGSKEAEELKAVFISLGLEKRI